MYDRNLIPDGVTLLEPAGLDEALLGWADVDGVCRAVYSYSELVRYFVKQFSDSDDPDEDALEFIEFNVVGLKLTNTDKRFCHPVIVADF